MLCGTKEKRWTAEDWDQVKQKLFMEKIQYGTTEKINRPIDIYRTDILAVLRIGAGKLQAEMLT